MTRVLLLLAFSCSILGCGGAESTGTTAEPTAVSSGMQTPVDTESCEPSAIEARAEAECQDSVSREDFEDPEEFDRSYPDAEGDVVVGCFGNACMSCTNEYLLRAQCECGDLQTCEEQTGAEWLQVHLGLTPNPDFDARVEEQMQEIRRRQAQ